MNDGKEPGMHPLTLIDLAVAQHEQRRQTLRRSRRVFRPRASTGDTPR